MPPDTRKQTSQPPRGSPNAIGDPLEFLRNETYRLRDVVTVLERVINGEGRADEIVSSCEFLSVSLPLHLFDMRSDLAILLEGASKPSDNVGRVFEEMASIEKDVRAKGGKVVAALLKHIGRDPAKGPTPATGRITNEFVILLRRLSAIESGILLPLSRVRLGSDELEELGRRMKSRRGFA